MLLDRIQCLKMWSSMGSEAPLHCLDPLSLFSFIPVFTSQSILQPRWTVFMSSFSINSLTSRPLHKLFPRWGTLFTCIPPTHPSDFISDITASRKTSLTTVPKVPHLCVLITPYYVLVSALITLYYDYLFTSLSLPLGRLNSKEERPSLLLHYCFPNAYHRAWHIIGAQ